MVAHDDLVQKEPRHGLWPEVPDGQQEELAQVTAMENVAWKRKQFTRFPKRNSIIPAHNISIF